MVWDFYIKIFRTVISIVFPFLLTNQEVIQCYVLLLGLLKLPPNKLIKIFNIAINIYLISKVRVHPNVINIVWGYDNCNFRPADRNSYGQITPIVFLILNLSYTLKVGHSNCDHF
jgi:hypothetical protein